MPSNFAKTGLLLVLMTGIFSGMGALVGGMEGLVVAFLLALGTNLFSFWNADTVVLKMFKAHELPAAEGRPLHELVEQLADRAGLPKPRIYLLNSPQPNAFATGRNPANAAVAVSTGLLDTLSWQELAGVIAHELAHVRNRDTLTMTVAATFAGAISLFANMLQFGFLFGGRRQSGPFGWLGTLAAVLIAPFAAMLVQMAISRSREYEADRVGAAICANPLWLASALRKIHAKAVQIPYEDAERVPAAAHLFIVNPLTGRSFDNLFTTHPDIENRIAELDRLAAEWQQQGHGSSLPPLQVPGEAAPGPWSTSAAGARPGSTGGPWG